MNQEMPPKEVPNWMLYDLIDRRFNEVERRFDEIDKKFEHLIKKRLSIETSQTILA